MTPEKPQWHNGQRFATRVHVVTFEGRYLFRVHGEYAYRMCVLRMCDPVLKEDRQITRVMLVRIPQQKRLGELKTYTVRDYGTAASAVLKRVGDENAWMGLKTYEFVSISKEDAWVYRKAVKDSLSSRDPDAKKFFYA